MNCAPLTVRTFRRASAGFIDILSKAPWAANVSLHFTDEGTRAILGQWQPDCHVYTCGLDSYTAAVDDAAQDGGYPDEARHLEHFSVPDAPDYVNHAFTLTLARSGQRIEFGANEPATDALLRAGVQVDVKCSDGLCGVCKCSVLSGEVEHRDYVLSKAQRQTSMILCQSRAAAADGVVEIDL